MRTVFIAILTIIALNGAVAPICAQPFGPPSPLLLFWWPSKDPPPIRPFVLSPAQERSVQEVLKQWQKWRPQQYSVKFTRWDYDTIFGPKHNDYLMAERHGEIKYRSPDKGLFKETEMKLYAPPRTGDACDRGHYESSHEQLDHWVFDGEKIYQFRAREKILEVTEISPDMRGTTITEGMLWFLFPIDPKSVSARYWCREKTPTAAIGKQVWLELWPKSARDSGNFQKVEVILEFPKLRVRAFQIFTPNGRDRTAYLFEDWQINRQATLSDSDFRPVLPIGWKRVSSSTTPAVQPVAPAVPSAISEEKPAKSVRKAVYSCRNRSRGKRCGLLKSRPGLPRFHCRG